MLEKRGLIRLALAVGRGCRWGAGGDGLGGAVGVRGEQRVRHGHLLRRRRYGGHPHSLHQPGHSRGTGLAVGVYVAGALVEEDVRYRGAWGAMVTNGGGRHYVSTLATHIQHHPMARS